MAQSVGNINHLSVIVDNELWKGAIGDTIRKYFGAEVAGLPQEEPLFSMRQMPPKAFSGFARKNRTFIKIEDGGRKNFGLLENKFANPQMGAIVSGTEEEIKKLIPLHAQEIIKAFKLTETYEKQFRISKSLEKIPQLKEKFGITVMIPSAYRVAKEEDDFFWLRKDIPNGTMDLMIYELPLGTISKDSNTIGSIIKMRDSIGALKVPVAANTGNFVTEEAYAPYLFETQLNGKFAYETKGTWEIKDRFMAGPFVNYAVEDKANNRLLVLEGFVFAPSAYKRDNIFELEAIIKTVKF